jgi:hypothetical protein
VTQKSHQPFERGSALATVLTCEPFCCRLLLRKARALPLLELRDKSRLWKDGRPQRGAPVSTGVWPLFLCEAIRTFRPLPV